MIQQFLMENLPFILSAIATLLSSLSAFLVRRINKNMEFNFMKFRTPYYRETEPAKAQSFDPLVTQYRYNKTTGELEELPDKLDIRKLVNSYLSTALEAMFDKFMPSDNVSDEVVDMADTRDDIDRLSDAMAFADDLKTSLGLGEFATLKDVHTALNARLEEQSKAAKEAELAKRAKSQEEALYAQFKAFMASQANGGDHNAS